MSLTSNIRYSFLTRLKKPRRYRALFEIIHQNACRRIVEIGVLHGVHARQMIQTASMRHPVSDIHYYGFDLFEELTDELLRSELSKKASSSTRVQQKLARTGAHIHLFQGDSKETLPQALGIIGQADFIFIDGGHSVETVRSDWNNVKGLMDNHTHVIFDDYYVDPDPEIAGKGCQAIIDQLDRKQYRVQILEPMDVFKKEWGVLAIRMAVVNKNAEYNKC